MALPRFVSAEAAARADATQHKCVGISPRMQQSSKRRASIPSDPSSDWRRPHDHAKNLMVSFTESDISEATTTATQTTVDSQATVLTSNVQRVRGTTYMYRGARPRVDEDALARIGRVAKKRIESIAQRDALIGHWRPRRPRCSATHECQVMEMHDSHHGSEREYKIVARMNISSSLRELMRVLSTDNAADFHQSMSALFGRKYLCGEKLHGFEKLHSRPSRRSSLLMPQPSRGRFTVPSSRSSMMSVNEIKVSLHAVTLSLRSRVTRKVRGATFLEYLDEKVEALTVTRVLQAIDLHQVGVHRQPTTKHAVDLGKLLIGYVIREDPTAKFTRVFFYAEAAPTNGRSRVSKRAIRLARSMVDTLSSLVAQVETQRLTQLFHVHRDDEQVPIVASRCCACDATLRRLSCFRSRQCACCRQAACTKCLDQREITKDGAAQSVRVCRACIERVSLPSLSASRRRRSTPDTRLHP